MKLDIALLADAATVDAAGKLNVLGAFHRLRGPEFPLRHGRIVLVLRFAPEVGDEGRLEVTIRMEGPDGKKILGLDGQVEGRSGEDPDRIRIPQVLNLDGIVFPVPGTYRFVIEVEGVDVETLPLRVEEGGPPRQGGGEGPGGRRPRGRGPTPIVVPPGSEGGVKA